MAIRKSNDIMPIETEAQQIISSMLTADCSGMSLQLRFLELTPICGIFKTASWCFQPKRQKNL